MKVFSTVLALLFTVSAAPTPVSAAPEIQWTDCPRPYGPGVECGALDVPLDHDNPDGLTIAIALVRLPATNPGSRLGTIFLNPGGPGGSGVDFVVSVGSALFSDEVRARFDLIGFDPRGIHRSEPLKCFAIPGKASSVSTLSWPFPLTLEEELARQKADNQLARACEQSGGEILHHMSTVDVARDLDLLRQAVGDEYLNYAGYSYGSFLGNVYANLYPDRVRAIVNAKSGCPHAAEGQRRRREASERFERQQANLASTLTDPVACGIGDQCPTSARYVACPAPPSRRWLPEAPDVGFALTTRRIITGRRVGGGQTRAEVTVLCEKADGAKIIVANASAREGCC